MYNAIHRCGGYKNIFLKGCGSGGGGDERVWNPTHHQENMTMRESRVPITPS